MNDQQPAPVATYLGGRAAAQLHLPVGAPAGPAIVLCPPFGWDEVCSYRSRREWANRLAAAGYPTVRLSYPATGDSLGGPDDAGLVDTWVESVALAADWARARTSVARVVAIGIELGGLLAVTAAARGAPLDDLILWAAPRQGRSFVRQLRAFSAIELSQFFAGLPEPPPLADGWLEAGGFALGPDTARDLEALDPTAMTFPASDRHVLLLGRDGIKGDGGLEAHLRANGAQVMVAGGPGYSAMCSHPQTARPSAEVMETVSRWLTGLPATDAPAARPAPGADAVLTGGEFREREFTVAESFGALRGVLTEPLGPRRSALCLVFLNAGAVRRTGPNRMWVEAARRWAANGVPSLRVDVEGIGDADGDVAPYADDAALYVPALVPQVLDALDALEAEAIGDRFVIIGLCAGAYWAFHAALRDPRVRAVLMVNPRALVWDPGLAPARHFRALLTERVPLAKLRRETDAARVRRLALWIVRAPVRWASRLARRAIPALRSPDPVDVALEQMLASGRRMLLLFACDERLHDELIRSGRVGWLQASPNVTFADILVRDHTLRPQWAQRQAHSILDRAIEHEIEAERMAASAESV